MGCQKRFKWKDILHKSYQEVRNLKFRSIYIYFVSFIITFSFYWSIEHCRATQWEDPRPLPPHFEARIHPETKRVYYVNHQLRTTTWEDPRPVLVVPFRDKPLTSRQVMLEGRSFIRYEPIPQDQRDALLSPECKFEDSEKVPSLRSPVGKVFMFIVAKGAPLLIISARQDHNQDGADIIPVESIAAIHTGKQNSAFFRNTNPPTFNLCFSIIDKNGFGYHFASITKDTREHFIAAVTELNTSIQVLDHEKRLKLQAKQISDPNRCPHCAGGEMPRSNSVSIVSNPETDPDGQDKEKKPSEGKSTSIDRLNAYKNILRMAVVDSFVTSDAERLLHEFRVTLKITDDEHIRVLGLLGIESPDYAEMHREIPQDTCVICLSNSLEMIILPCFHYCLCASCSTSFQGDLADCPLCQTKIERIEKVYR